MRIVNGRWMDELDDSSIDVFNYEKFKNISRAVVAIYGEEINHVRIDIICSLIEKNEQNDEQKEIQILETLKNI
jgi:hypothetical protein